MNKKVPILFVSFLLISASILSQTHVWTGNGSGNDWSDTNNWNVGTVPDASSDVSIPGGFAVNIENTIASANSIEILGDSGLIVFNDLNIVSQITIGPLALLRFHKGIISGGGMIENTGTMELLGPDQKEFSNIIINNDHMIWVLIANQIHTTNNTVINNNVTGELQIASVGGFLNQGTSATLNNFGLLRKLNDGVNPIGNFYLILDINNSGTIQVDADETFLILGGGLDFNNLETGIIQGFGTLDITSNFSNQGTIAPGALGSVGTLHITNNFEVGSNGILDLDIAGTDMGDYDTIENFGNPILEGSLDIHLSFDPMIDDEFTVITGILGIGTCNFPQYATASYMGTEYTFETLCNSNDVVLKVVDQILDYNGIKYPDYDLFIHPNPVGEEAQIVIPDFSTFPFTSEELIIRIYTTLEQLVMKFPVDSEATDLDTSHLQSGFYFIKLMEGNNLIGKSKFIVE